MIAVIILVLDAVISSLKEWDGVRLYGVQAFSSSAAEFARDSLAGWGCGDVPFCRLP